MPLVSIIIPCYNEQSTIRKLLEAIYAQTYPLDDMEVVIADGLSTDGTRDEITAFSAEHPNLFIAVIDNPIRIIPAALNQAIQNSRGEIFIRLDAHSLPYPDYVERCVDALSAGIGDNVGGIWEILPSTQSWIADSIAIAAAHPLGVGDAYYRHANKTAYVDTVPFGAFKRELLTVTGFFDETLLTNEDYEFNTRIRQSGGRIWLDPAIRSIYFARSNLAALASQYWRYGYWKLKMLQRYPNTLRLRQGLPPLFVLSLLVNVVLAVAFPLFRLLLVGEISIYTLILILVAVQKAFRLHKPYLVIGLPLSIATMHLAWGAGFLWSMIKGVFTLKNERMNAENR